MSDPRNPSVLGGARQAGPLNGPVAQSHSRGLTGPPRGAIVVAEGPKSKAPAKKKAAPKVAVREISVYGAFKNPWKTEADEVDAMAHNRWEPTSDDFAAVAGESAVKITSWKGLMQVILTKGDAESAVGSISRINIFTHANPSLIALAGEVRPGAAAASVWLYGDGISDETLDQLDSGINMKVVSKNKKVAEKKFVLDDVRKRFTKDAVIVIYACHGAVDVAFVQHFANTFQVKVRAFRDVIGYFPSFDEADPAAKRRARVTNRRKVGVGHDSPSKFDDFHQLDSNATDRPPHAEAQSSSTSDDDD
jgi:hypothetical protein